MRQRPSGSRRALAALALAAGACAVLGAAPAAASGYRPAEYGYGYGELENPRTLAMGGAARAFGWSTSAIDSNPANAAAQPVYHAEGFFGYDTTPHRMQYGVSVLDAVTSRLAMGVQALRSTLGNDSDSYQRSATDVRIAGAYALSDRFSLGVTGRWLRAAQDGYGPLGPSAASKSSGDPNATIYTFDAGLMAAITDWLRLGAVGYNLTAPQNGLAPLMLGGAAGVRLGEFTIEGDVVGVDKTYWGAWKARYEGGAELLLADRYPIRLGFLYDTGAKRSSLSGGVGYVDTQFAFDVGVRGDLSAPDVAGKAMVFMLGLRYFLDAGLPQGPTSQPVL